MPCAGPSPAEEIEMQRQQNDLDYGLRFTNHQLITRVACELAAVVPAERTDWLPDFVRKWAKKHDEEDLRRRAAETRLDSQARKRKAAMEKLTPQDRAALGFGEDD